VKEGTRERGRVTRARISVAVDAARMRARLHKLRAGDDDAFTEVYATYLPAIERYLGVLVRADDAADVAQQVFLDVFTHRENASTEPESFEHWLFMIARHRALDLIRKLGRVHVTETSDVNAMRERRRAPIPQRGTIDLARHVKRLPAGHREALALRYLFSLTTSEIAQATGRSADAVRQTESRALARLRRELVPNYAESRG